MEKNLGFSNTPDFFTSIGETTSINMPSIKVDDILKLSNISGIKDISEQLNQEQIEYLLFIDYIDFTIGKSGDYCINFNNANYSKSQRIAYLQGRVDQFIEDLCKKYIEPGLRDEHIEFDKSDAFFRNTMSGYVLNFLFKLNGYEITEDVHLGSLISKLPPHPQKKNSTIIPVQKTSKKLDEKAIKSSLNDINRKNKTWLERLIGKEDLSKE
ncbi:MAG: hypothetical protein PHS54_06910 [Clostridia bacterium]|nr:hypothetical protein [Clostridia bacterium]